jgi:hypothetical protein
MRMGILYGNSNKLPKYKPVVVYTSTTIQTLGSYLYAEVSHKYKCSVYENSRLKIHFDLKGRSDRKLVTLS